MEYDIHIRRGTRQYFHDSIELIQHFANQKKADKIFTLPETHVKLQTTEIKSIFTKAKDRYGYYYHIQSENLPHPVFTDLNDVLRYVSQIFMLDTKIYRIANVKNYELFNLLYPEGITDEDMIKL